MNIWEILPSALASLTGQGEYVGKFPSAENVVVLLIDGMGVRNLQHFHDTHPIVERLLISPGRTTLPSTTPVALASLGTSKAPLEHGFLGATFLVDGQLLQPLKWSNDPHPFSLWPDTTMFEEADEVGVVVRRVGPGAYRHSGLTNAVLRGGEHIAAETLEDLVEVLPDIKRPSISYGYYPKLDRIGHVFGCTSMEYKSELSDVLMAIETLESRLPSSTLLVVTADHGMVDMKKRVWLEDDATLMSNVDFITGEPRFRHIYTKSVPQVLARYQKLEKDFLILHREEFISMEGRDTTFQDRIGDIVLIAKQEDVGFCSRDIDNRVSSLIGQHGGASDSERDIPIALMAGYARG